MQLKTLLASLATTAAVASAAPFSNNTTQATRVPRYPKGEIGMDLCRHQYVFTHEEWRMQVPREWWQEKFHKDHNLACRAWKRSLQSERMCGLRFNNCFVLVGGGGSGEEGWLFASATTCIGPMSAYVENAFQVFDVGKGKKREIVCHSGIRL